MSYPLCHILLDWQFISPILTEYICSVWWARQLAWIMFDGLCPLLHDLYLLSGLDIILFIDRLTLQLESRCIGGILAMPDLLKDRHTCYQSIYVSASDIIQYALVHLYRMPFCSHTVNSKILHYEKSIRKRTIIVEITSL